MAGVADMVKEAKRFMTLAGKVLRTIVGGLILLGFLQAAIMVTGLHIKDGGRYVCHGTLTSIGASRESQMFLRIEQYRKLLMLWGASDGIVRMEIPGLWNGAMSLEDANSLDLWFLNDGPGRKNVGRISRLSDTISVMTPYGVFDGSMKRIE